MTAPTGSTVPAGWYPDPVIVGALRYFDGTAWTDQLTPAADSLGASPSDPVHWLVPSGRTWQSIAAGYVALFAIALWCLGPLAVALGVLALRASARSGSHGRGRAVFAIVVGSLASLAALMFVLTRL